MASQVNSVVAGNYDEDIAENPFFRFLCSEHSQFFEVASESRWIICVPRRASLPLESLGILDDQDIAAYILVPQDDEGLRYKTLNGRRVEISSGHVTTISGFEENDDVVAILFEETFFNVNDESYKVLCLEKPFDLNVILNATFDDHDGAGKRGERKEDEVKETDGFESSRCRQDVDSYSLDDCARILWGEGRGGAAATASDGVLNKRRVAAASTRLRNSLEALVRKFNKIDDVSNECLTLVQLVDRVHTVYKDALSLVLYAKRKGGDSLSNNNNNDNSDTVGSVKLALETFILHNVHVNLWTNLARHFSEEDAEFNRISRNLAPWVSLADLGGAESGRSEFQVNLPRARQILAKLNQVVTPRGKARVLRKTVEVLSQVRGNGGGISGGGSRRQSYDVRGVVIDSRRQSCDVGGKGATGGGIDAKLIASRFYVNAQEEKRDQIKELTDKNEGCEQIITVDGGDDQTVPSRNFPSQPLPAPLSSSASQQPSLPAPPPPPPPNPPAAVLTSDDLLPLLCFLIVRSDCIANWKANLFYLRQLQFANSKIDQNAFLLTSFEAALLHVESFAEKDSSPAFCIPVCKSSLDFNLSGKSNDVRDGIFRLFTAVSKGDVDKVSRMLSMNDADVDGFDAGNTFARLSMKEVEASKIPDVDAEIASTVLSMGDGISRTVGDPLRSFCNECAATLTSAPIEDSSPQEVHETVSSSSPLSSISTTALPHPAHSPSALSPSALSPSAHSPSAISSPAPAPTPTPPGSPSVKCHPLCRCVKCRLACFSRRNSLASTIMTTAQTYKDDDDDDDDVNEGVTLFAKDDRGYSALHVAALFGQTQMVELLVDLGALVNAADHYGRTPLHLVCMRGGQKAVLLLLHSKADPNLRDCDGMTALHATVVGGHLVCAKALLYYDQGYLVDVNATTNNGDTALHVASRLGYVDLVDTLLENGASVVLKNAKNETPLHCSHSVVVGKKLASAYQRLLEERKLEAAEVQKAVSAAKILKKNESIKRRQSQQQQPPRTVADPQQRQDQQHSQQQHPQQQQHQNQQQRQSISQSMPGQLVNSLATSSPSHSSLQNSILATNNNNSSQALYSSLSSTTVKTSALSSSSSSSLSDDAYFRKVERLFRAIGDGDEQLVRHFMGWDWDESVSSSSPSSSSPSSSSASQRQLCHPLCDCEDCHPIQRQMQATIKSGLTVSCANREGITPLHIAALSDSLTLARLFMHKGAEVNAKSKTQNWSPLHLASQRNSVHVGGALLRNGADVNAPDIRGNTALHYAALNGFVAVAEILLQGGGGGVFAPKDGGRNKCDAHAVDGNDEEEGGDKKSSSSPSNPFSSSTPSSSSNRFSTFTIPPFSEINVNAANVKGNTPLHFLAGRGINSANSGSLNGQDSDSRVKDEEEGLLQITKLLLAKGANVRSLNRQNRTPFDLAELDCIRELLKVEGGGSGGGEAAAESSNGGVEGLKRGKTRALDSSDKTFEESVGGVDPLTDRSGMLNSGLDEDSVMNIQNGNLRQGSLLIDSTLVRNLVENRNKDSGPDSEENGNYKSKRDSEENQNYDSEQDSEINQNNDTEQDSEESESIISHGESVILDVEDERTIAVEIASAIETLVV